MVDRSDISDDAIGIAASGYENFNIIAHKDNIFSL